MVSGGGGGGSTEVARFHALLGLNAAGFTAGMAAARAQSMGLRGALAGGAGLTGGLLGARAGMAATGRQAAGLSAGMAATSRQASGLRGGMRGVQTGMAATTAQAAGLSAGMAATSRQASGLRTALIGGAGLGAALIGIQLGMAAISKVIGGSIRNVIEYETAFVGLQKTVELSAAEFEILDANIRRLATTMPVGRIELARIGQIAGQLGVEGVNDLTTFIETIAMIGPTTDLTTEVAAIGFARLLTIMQEPTSQVGVLAAQIVSLGNNFAAMEPEILNFATRIAVAGNLVGFSTGEVLALGTSLAALGIRAELGGTAMQRALLTINQAVIESGEELELLAAVSGLSAEEFAEQWEVDAFGAFQRFLAGLGRAGDTAVAVLDTIGLAGQRNMQAMLALSTNVDLLADAFANQAAQAAAPIALTEEFGKIAATTASQLSILGSNVVELADNLGEPLVAAIDEAVPVLIGFIDDMNQALEENEEAWETWARRVGLAISTFAQIVGTISTAGPQGAIGGAVAGAIGGLFGGPELPGDPGVAFDPAELMIDRAFVRAAARAQRELDRWAASMEDASLHTEESTTAIEDRINALLASIAGTGAAATAEDALTRAREAAVLHIEDVMTTRLVEAFITGGDAAVEIQRQTNAALLVEFEAQREGIQAITGDIADFTFDMWLSIKDGAAQAAKVVEDEMARLTQSVVSAFTQAASGNLAGAIGSFGKLLGPEQVDKLSGVTALLAALAGGAGPTAEMNNILQTLLGVSGASFSPVITVKIGTTELHDIVVEAITEANTVGALS